MTTSSNLSRNYLKERKIRILVDDELSITDPQKLRLLESLQQAEKGETYKVDLDKFL